MKDWTDTSEPIARRLRLYSREIGVAIALTLATLAGILLLGGAKDGVSAVEPVPGMRQPLAAR